MIQRDLLWFESNGHAGMMPVSRQERNVLEESGRTKIRRFAP